jgi:mannose-6-phosphate isomerase-like protein (cupin superfamily)
MAEAAGVHRAQGEGLAWWFLGSRTIVKADRGVTGGAFTLLEFSAPYGFGPPLHIHHNEDEAFIVVSGSLLVACGDQEWEVGPGGFAYLPRDIPHSFVVNSREPVFGWTIATPSGFEDFVAEVSTPPAGPGLPPPSPPDIPALIAAAGRHGSEIVGPPMQVRPPSSP